MKYLHILTICLHLPILPLAIMTIAKGFRIKKRPAMHFVDFCICLSASFMSLMFVNAQIEWIRKNRDTQVTDIEAINWIMFDLSFPVVIIFMIMRLSMRDCSCSSSPH